MLVLLVFFGGQVRHHLANPVMKLVDLIILVFDKLLRFCKSLFQTFIFFV